MDIPDYAIFILSHNRPECQTYKFLKRTGFTGKIFIILDDKDEAIDLYKSNFGEECIFIFNKQDYVWVDMFDNFKQMLSPVYARNATFEFAKNLGIDYFIMLDDDISGAQYRFMDKGKCKAQKVGHSQNLFDLIVKEFSTKKSIGVLSFNLQTNFFGDLCAYKRDPISMFLLRTNTAIRFRGRFAEDVDFSVRLSNSGLFTIAINDVLLSVPNAANGIQKGGLQSDDYKRAIVKRYNRFIGVSAIKKINRQNLFPVLLSSRFCK